MRDDKFYTLEQVKADPDGDYILAKRDGEKPLYRRVGDDADIYQAALEEWLGVLGQLWTAFGKDIDPEQMTIYQRNLVGVPMGLLEQAIRKTIRNHRFNNVPTVGEVWQSIQAVLGNPRDVDDAIQRWQDAQLSAVVYRFGSVVAVETEE